MLFLPLHLRSECEQNCWDPKDGELCLNRVKPGTWRNTAWAWGIGGLGGTSGNIVLEEHSVNRGHCWKSSQSWKSVKHEELIKRIPCWDHKSFMPNTNCTSIQVFVERMNEGIDGLFHWRPWRLRWLDAWQMCLNNLYVLCNRCDPSSYPASAEILPAVETPDAHRPNPYASPSPLGPRAPHKTKCTP